MLAATALNTCKAAQCLPGNPYCGPMLTQCTLPSPVHALVGRYHALHALSALLSTAPERVQAAVLSAPLGVIRLMDLLACGREVLRNEALLLLVGLCSGCEEMSKIVAFEGAFERLLALVREEGGPLAGGVLVQDALELINNLLRDSPANQRLFREMGHANELPKLLHYEPPAATAGAEGAMAAAGFVEAAAAAAAAAASANGPGGAARGLAANAAAAAATGAAAAAAAAGAQAMPPQTAANFLVALETARLLLVAPSADDASARSQQASHRAAGQDALGKLGLAAPLIVLCLDEGGVPSAAVRAQVWQHAMQGPALHGVSNDVLEQHWHNVYLRDGCCPEGCGHQLSTDLFHPWMPGGRTSAFTTNL